jgi:glycogen(starch) synthase
MRIAFVSYEYPPDTADGGIATYVQQAAQMLQNRGHEVEVFAASRDRTHTRHEPGLRVYRIQAPNRQVFAEQIAPVFARRHSAAPFDVLEGPDYHADASEIVRLVPDLPLVVRLHTPQYLAAALHQLGLKCREEDRRDASPWEPWLKPLPTYDLSLDPEYRHVLQADRISSPSKAIRDVICRDWRLDPDEVDVVPNVYRPSSALLELPVSTRSNEIVFLGRLQLRKGVLPLARAIPQILHEFPEARFRFVGRSLASPEPDLDMQQYLQRLLSPYSHAVAFSGQVALKTIPAVLGPSDICVFPSLWENFPYVCLEAMAAGRGIVGSRAGGMAEMLQEESGILVTPDRPEEIAAAVLALLKQPERRERMGQNARERVQRVYSPAQIAPLQEANYERAIQRSESRI